MIWGGGLCKSGKKMFTTLPAGEKNSTATCLGKNTQLNNLEEKKVYHELYVELQSPEHGQTCILHTI